MLIRGFQPSHVSLWKYDRGTSEATMLSTIAEKSHRNSVKWNNFGRHWRGGREGGREEGMGGRWGGGGNKGGKVTQKFGQVEQLR